MRQFGLGLSLVLLSLGCHANRAADVAAAEAAIQEFAGALQTELKAAMKAGGPVTAIAVCNTRAMPITSRVAEKHGMQLSRVSLKNRNPHNAANSWQAAVLAEFENKRLSGTDSGQLGWTETVDVGGGREFRFMKAIPTGDICLRCHGTELAPDITRVLNELYPDDLATGYSRGDIRGAFVVTRMIPD